MSMMFKKKKDEDAKPIDQEIAELQRKFRLLENDKKATSEESQGTIRKHRSTIEKLTRDNRKMKAELNETRSTSSAQVEAKMAQETIQKLKEQKESLEAKVGAELDFAKELAEQVETTNKNIFGVRQEMATNGGINASAENHKAVHKQIRILENRLDKALQKFNEAIGENRTLREQIDTLRRERVVFDDIYLKLQNELQQKKKEMANIIEQANAAYEARDQAQAQMAALKQQADREHAEFEKEWKELGNLIGNDKKMREFMRTKLKDSQALTSGDTTKEPDEKSRKKITRNAWNNFGMMASVTANQEKVTSYEEAFARIQAATGHSDLETLVQEFISAEDTNFSLFKYNNELRYDIEHLEQQIADYKEEVILLSGTGSRREDTEKVKSMESLEEKCADVIKRGKHYEAKYQESKTILDSVRQDIETIFIRVDGQPSDLPSGCGNAISDTNLMQYLAVIEGRTNELLKIYDALQNGDDDLETTRPPRPGASSASLQINKLPSTVEDYSDDEDDDDDDESRPFTVEELKAKTRLKTKKAMTKTKAKSRG